MKEIQLKDMQQTIQQNQEQYQQVIEDFSKELGKMNSNRRCRPKHSDEDSILSSFKRK